MSKLLIKQLFSLISGGVAVATLGASMALAQATTSSGPRSDGQIEMDVVHALDGSQALKDDLITAATIQGEVTLSGTVASESSRQLAESLAKSVPGVSKVHNNLKIGNPAQDANAQNVPPDQMGQNDQDYDQQQPAPPQSGAPDYGQNGQNPGENQAPPPDWGQSQQPPYGQSPAPQSGQYPGYGQAPPPPGYGQNYPPQYQPYPPQPQPQAPQYQIARGPIGVPAGTLIQVRTSGPINSKQARGGEPVQFTVIQDVVLGGGVLAIPRGATVHGVIAEVQHPEKGSLTGSAELALQLTALDLSGLRYPLESDLFKVKGPGKGERSAGNIAGGAILGAIIGGIAGGGTGAAIGAAAGGGVGAVGSAASSGPGVWIPAEALVSFHLMAPVTVQPVSAQEAMQLAQGLYPGGPRLYRRGPAANPYRPSPYPYPYYAEPVYYRPYYMVGGYYYWR